jgi:hypothetical protein
MPRTPSTAIIANQITITGPNTAPTLAVPCFWNRNSRIRIITVAGTTARSMAGAASETPSTAPSTEMAGVMMPSP